MFTSVDVMGVMERANGRRIERDREGFGRLVR